MRYNGAEITIKLLERQGIQTITGIPGGSNLPIYDALYNSKINHILTRHEQGGGFIAQGMARATGETAVCFATSGPGATNLLTAIADAKIDSVPMVAITGQVSLSLIGTDAFQEIDAYGLTVPITKHNFLIRSAEELLTVIPEAFKIAQSGRPGPVLVDIPKNVQLEEIEVDFDNLGSATDDVANEEDKALDKNKGQLIKIAEAINNSKRPVLYIGGGVTIANAGNEIYNISFKNNIPVASTLMALGCFPCDNKLDLKMLGMHGANYTNKILHEADLLIGLGVRFDDRATGNILKFCPDASIVHIDIDEAEINKIKRAHLSMAGNLGTVLKELINYINEDKREEWVAFVEETKEKFPLSLPEKENTYHPINIITKISEMVEPDTIITTDVGQHQMWVAQCYPFNYPRTLLTSGGLGTMGFGLPAAIGAALSKPDKKVICFSGDGSILMNIQELATLADLNLDVKIIIMNNKHLGLVRQQQELFYNKNYIASKFITNPDFKTIGLGFGIESYDLEGIENPYPLLNELLNKKGPALINVPISEEENVLPMVPPGAGNYEAIG